MKQLLIREENYIEQMENIVEPYLLARERELWPERESGKLIHCMNYQADAPIGIVMLCHGFTETAEKYKEIIYYFLKKNYHVYMPEHCGHGKSYRLTEDSLLVHVDSYERYVKDFLYVAHMAHMEHPDLPMMLYGHSMGGGIGAVAAAREPELFKKVILSSPMIRPATRGIPWHTASAVTEFFCRTGREMRYILGQQPAAGKENFEESSATSKVRFDYYQQKREKEPLYQMRTASYGWTREAVRLNRELERSAFKNIKAPILLFQAEREYLVSKKEQRRFAAKLWRQSPGSVKVISVPDTKHEIFNSKDKILEKYWTKIFSFLEN